MPQDFSKFSFREPIQRALDEAGFDTPTPIQEKAIPILMKGHDLIGVAETGTGKTLAYLLPIFQEIEPGGAEPQAAVICPTRELAIQVGAEAVRFGEHLGVRTVVAYGGTSSGDQKRALTEGRDLVVATPGRLLDFVTSAWLTFRRLKWLVLDEADRMLDMGFINDVDAILRHTPMSRQTMLFSATFPDQLKALSDRFMLHPETVRMHTGTRVTDRVNHAMYPVAASQKPELLIEILHREKPAKALIFTATREGTSELALRLRRRGYEVVSLSSLLSQANRERALRAFRAGEYRMLVATDVAARGLDITDIDLVVNFDAPMHAEDYVHRIGRTGRAERCGRAVTLITRDDERKVAEIERLLEEPVPIVRLEDFKYATIPDRESRGSREGGPRRRREGGRGGARGRSSSAGTTGGGDGRRRRRKAPGKSKPKG